MKKIKYFLMIFSVKILKIGGKMAKKVIIIPFSRLAVRMLD